MSKEEEKVILAFFARPLFVKYLDRRAKEKGISVVKMVKSLIINGAWMDHTLNGKNEKIFTGKDKENAKEVEIK